MRVNSYRENSSERRNWALRVTASIALASSLVPAVAFGILSNSSNALADPSIDDRAAYAHLSDTAPLCVRECVAGYLDETIDADALEKALADLAEEGRITRSQLNAYLEILANNDTEGLRSLCLSDQDGSDDREASGEEGSPCSGESGSADSSGADVDDGSAAPSAGGDDSEGEDAASNGDGSGSHDAAGNEDASGTPDASDDDVPSGTSASDEDFLDEDAAQGDSLPDDGATEGSPSLGNAKHPLSKSSTRKKASASDGGAEKPSGQSISVTRATHDLTTEQFIAVIGEQSRQIAQDSGLYASVMIAQAVLESGSGSSLLSSAPFYNLFGIKGAHDGNSVEMKTKEDDGTGNYYTISASFRDYASYSESLHDYAALLTEENAGFYSGALKKNAKSPYEAAKFLQGRYATSTSYAESLIALIDLYGLTRYDAPLPYEPDEQYFVEAQDGQGNVVKERRTVADLLAVATSYLGTDYVWGGNAPETGFDCSGLVQYSYSKSLGVSLPRTTYVQCKVGDKVEFDDLHPGDLLFFERDGDVHHVGLYLGNGFFIHAPQTGDVVKVTALEDYPPSFATRIVSTHAIEGKKSNSGKESAKAQNAVSDITLALNSVMHNMGDAISDNVALVIEEDE